MSSSNNSAAHDAAASGDEAAAALQQQEEPACPLSPPKTHRDTSIASSPFVISTVNDEEASALNVKKKGRFTVKTTSIENEDTNYKAKETISPQVLSELRPRLKVLSPDESDADSRDSSGLNSLTRPIIPSRRNSSDSYISDDSSSHEELSPDRKNSELEISPDINMTYSPEHHPHLVGRLLNQSPGKQSHITSVDATSAAQYYLSQFYENPAQLGGNHNPSLMNFDSGSSSLPTFLGDEQAQFSNLLSHGQLGFLPLPQRQRTISSEQSVRRPPTLKMRCNSEPLFPLKSSGNLEVDNLNIANYSMEEDGNNWTSNSTSGVYSSDNSESIDEDLPAIMSSPLGMPEGEMIPSGRQVPVHIDSNTPTPTHAEGARHFYSNQQSAQKVAELQATAPLAHRPYLDYDEDLTPHSTSNTNTPMSTGGYTDDDDRDHMYWRPNTASFPDLITADLYPSRWAMLLYLSLLNLLSGWICFSIAPVATMLKGDIDAESLVSLFLIASAAATFCAPAMLSCLGVRHTVLLGAVLLLVGLCISCAASDFVEGLHAGFIIAGLGQPLNQITPVFVVTAWFPPSEHKAMLRIVLQSNHLGVMFSFLCGTFLVSSESDIIPYFQCIIFIASILFITMFFHFQEAPPTPMPQTNMVFKEVEHAFSQQQLPGIPSEVALEFTDTNDSNDTNESTGNIVSNNRNDSSSTADRFGVYTEQLKEGAGHPTNFSYGSINFSYGSIEPISPFPNLQGSFTPRGHQGQIEVLVPQQHIETPRNQKATFRDYQVWTLMKTYFSTEGSIRCSIAFVTSGVVANSLTTFMSYLLGASGSSKILVGAIGSAFQLFIMVSPFIVDRWANPSRRHSLLSASLLAGVIAMMMCMMTMEWGSFAGLISSLLTVALIVGSLQTLSTRYQQMSESSVLIIFQLLSNTFSSMAIQLFRSLQAESIAESAPEFSLPFIFLIAMNMIAATCFFGGNRNSSSNVEQHRERYPFLLKRRTPV